MVDMEKLAQKAQDRKTYREALSFTPDGDKFATGHAYVRCEEIGLRPVTNPKAKPNEAKEFLVINVELLKASDFGQVPGSYSLQTAAANSSLTDGILQAWMNGNKNLEGVVLDVETYNYDHKKHGKTRGYRVTVIDRERQTKLGLE